MRHNIENEMNTYNAQKTSEQPMFSILLLGLGSGDLAMTLPDGADIDIVEIDPLIYKVAVERFRFSVSQNQHVIIDDARNFLRTSQKKYDVVVSDVYVGNNIPEYMYSKEAFELIKYKLKPSGLLLANINARPTEEDRLLTSILKTASVAFPSVRVSASEPEEIEKLQPLILHFAKRQLYNSSPSKDYTSMFIDYDGGDIVTDDYNPLAILGYNNAKLFREQMFIFGGSRLFFSI